MVVDDSEKENGLNFVFFLEICGYAFAQDSSPVYLITFLFIRT